MAPEREPAPPRHFVVLIVLDGGNPSYLNLGHLPHLQALMRRGVVYDRAWVGQMESTTPGVHVSFGTGTLPRENGFFGFGWIDPQTRRRVDYRSLLADGAIDPVLRQLPVPSVAGRLRQFLPAAVSVAASGHKDYAVVGLGGGTADYEVFGKFTQKRYVPTFLHTPPPLTAAERSALNVPAPLPLGEEDAWAFRYAITLALKVHPKLLMLNLPEVDTWGHWYGPDNHKVFAKLMRGVDRGIGQLEAAYRQLGVLNRTDFIITADHGMMESRPAHNWPVVLQAAQAVGAEVLRSGSGPAWLQNPTQAKVVAEQLVAMHPAHIEAVFYRSSPALGYRYVQASPTSWLVNQQVATAYQHLVDTTACANGPDLWVFYQENYSVVARNVAGIWKGTHGGSTWKVQYVPLVLSGPDIRQGVHSDYPARAIDIAPTMERLLGLPPIHRDGVALADALLDATASETRAQSTAFPSLVSDVEALQAQSQADDQSEPPLSVGAPFMGALPTTSGRTGNTRPHSMRANFPTNSYLKLDELTTAADD